MGDPSVNPSDGVASVTFYQPAAGPTRLDVAPFIALYAFLVSLLFGAEEDVQIWYRLAVIFAVVVHGVVALACFWSVGWLCLVRMKRVEKISDATVAKMVPTGHQGSSRLCPIQTATGSFRTGDKFVSFNKQDFWYDAERNAFETMKFPVDLSISEYLSSKGLASEKEVTDATGRWGANNFDIPIPTFVDLYKEHAVAPFFVFQIFCVALWCLDEYWYYSVFTLFMLLMFEATVVKQRLRNLVHIRGLAPPAYTIPVYRGKKWTQMDTTELLPGDLVALTRPTNEDNAVPCDILIVNGTCIVNEAMLTGESKPQAKESVALRPGDHVLDMEVDKRHIAFGGTRVVQSHSDKDAPVRVAGAKDAPLGSAVGYVLRTGFDTSQGRLVRTILFSAERMTAHSMEVFFFILFLLMFAIAAAYYVFTEGLKDPDRSRYKLVLECVLIITSVVPPELPMELSLAVNSSLIALASMKVWCTEPFRIPHAGRLNICCFDKTGTLTKEELHLEGIGGLDADNPNHVTSAEDIPEAAAFVLGACHGLVFVDGGLIGDPMEKTVLDAIKWSYSKNDIAGPKKGANRSLRVIQRHGFQSSLKRSSVIVSLDHLSAPHPRALVKGAPETIRSLLKSVPAHYNETYNKFALDGKRVLALAYKDIPAGMSTSDIRRESRDWAECDLTFAGFLVLHCPLKKTSLSALNQLARSGHKNVMITGDNPLTACFIASELEMNRGKDFLVLSPDDKGTGVLWKDPANDGRIVSFDGAAKSMEKLSQKFALCCAGPALSLVDDISGLVGHTDVFARVSPQQKENVLAEMNKAGHVTMMCGDGTNDVGALKQAHVGIALLNKDVELPQRKPELQRLADARAQMQRQPRTLQEKMEQLKKEAEAMEEPMIRLGDASIAAPFTSKSSSPEIVPSIIRQGRCTLVTTMQMYKILALNCLVSAYSLSVLYLDGVKYGDTQMTLQGMTIAILFLFISRSKPLPKLAKEQPISKIFSLQTISSVLGQFAIHLMCLILAVNMAHEADPDRVIDLEGDFKPNVLNTVVYLVSACMLISIFATNYQGYPHMQGVFDNKPMLYAVVGELFLHAVLALELSTDLADTFELTPMPTAAFRSELCQILLFDFVGAFLYDRLCKKLFPAPRR